MELVRDMRTYPAEKAAFVHITWSIFRVSILPMEVYVTYRDVYAPPELMERVKRS
jgi:hypothetical protein